MVAIYPNDKTTNFLSSIISENIIEVVEIMLLTETDIINTFRDGDPTKSILFLGHGNASELNTNLGVDLIIDTSAGRQMFKDKKIIVISCYSADFIIKLKNEFKVALGFGNIPTSIGELSKKKIEKYYVDMDESIELYKSIISEIFKKSIKEAHSENMTFFEFYNAIKLRINKSLSFSVLQNTLKYRLVGELLFDLKKEMLLLGDYKAYIN